MTDKRLMYLFAPLLILLFLCISADGFAEESADCLSCHSVMTGRVKGSGGVLVELNVDADKFQKSVHGALSCTDCHLRLAGGSHGAAGAAVPADVLALSSRISAKHPTDAVAAAACSTCHEEVYRKVLASVHGRNILEKHQKDGALCIDCHGSPHYIAEMSSPDAKMGRQHQVETCGRCHGNADLIEKYNLEENVMKSFEESFHGRKLHLGHTRAPVCTSCHSSHDITTKDDPASPVFGNNKLQTCGKCHEGANEKFIPAITHRPPGPIPHYAEKALILLTMGVFAFIVSHVLLEALADIRDAMTRKGEKHS